MYAVDGPGTWLPSHAIFWQMRAGARFRTWLPL